MANEMISKNYEVMENSAYSACRNFIIEARQRVYTAVNSAMVEAYWNIGKSIYEACDENDRAKYGEKLLEDISTKLSKEFGKGFSVRNLRNMRTFYSMFQNRKTVSAELSWSHYCLLMRIENEERRNFYLKECVASSWSVRQLERQINSFYFDRILASKDKKAVAEEIQKLEPKPEYEKIVKDPHVLEFLDLPQNAHFYESELEQALIDHLQNFLLELGRGFSFIARQKHFQVDGRHFYIDLLFYNYILKCFVIIDLKTGDLTHQDLGQMQMYVNYYTREMMNEGDNPPIGIVLCADKSETLVEYTLPEGNNQIFAAKYKTYLPTKEELIKELNLENFKKLDK